MMSARYAHAAVSLRGLALALGLLLLALVSTLLGIRHTDAQGTAQAVPVDSQVRISYSGLILNRSTNTFDTVATLTNTGTIPVLAPLSLVITSITPASVQLANSTGMTSGGLPYLNIPLATGSFNPGATLTPVVLKFRNPNRVSFTFTQSILGVVGSANHAPVADAGPNQTVAAGATVQLDGTQSTDVDGNPLTHQWSFVSIPGGSQAVLANATTVNPSFVADQLGTYTVQLIVNDGQVDSAPATVVISTQNSPPVANAGPNQLVASGTTVQLDGSHSTDVDGDVLTYLWSFVAVPAGSQAQLAGPTTVNPSFLADKPGVYTVQLIVNDGQLDSAPANVIISTQSAPPVADASADQTVVVGATVQLDGSKSAAANGGPLTYRWALITRAPGSTATLVNPTTVNPSFVVDRAGIYVVQLIVNDGLVDSAPTTVVIRTGNSRPVADAGPNQTAQVGQTVTLDGTGSHDADNDALSFDWSLLSKPANSSAILNGADQSEASFVPDLPGIFIAQLIVRDGQLDSDPVTTTVTITVPPLNRDPQITSAPVITGQQGVAYSYQVVASDADGDPLSYALTVSPLGMTISSTGLIDWTPSGSGTFAVEIKVTDGRGGSATQSYNVVVDPALVSVPNVVGLTQATATTAITSANLMLGTVTQQTSATVPTGNVISQDPAAGTAVAQGSPVSLVVSTGPSDTGLPPDPATVAPPLDPTVANNMWAATGFLYNDANPIQTGVAPGTIDPKRIAVLRGKVLNRGGAALTAVKINIVGHPEFGQTLSRADGAFDLAANGGSALTVRYEKAGYLPSQRQVQVAWQEYTLLPDVVLVVRDAQVTTINFGAAIASMQVARSSLQTDADGTRRATVLFPAGTTAGLVQPDGSTVPTGTLNVRLTEYTVGPNGPQAMPGALPPTSAYTYAVDLGADEAVAKVNGRDVVFNQPVILYVENFLNIPVGKDVPVGYFDSTQSAWVGSPNGRVIKVLGSTAGLADLDLDGDGLADGPAALAALGITVAERQQVASQYAAGVSLWRTPLDHFSSVDCNWAARCKILGCTPPQELPPIPRPCTQNSVSGSVIGCERQTLGEQLELTGSPFTLHYESDRVPGRTAEQNLLLSLGTGGVPSGVQGIEVEILVAGKKLSQHLPATTTSTAVAWDFKDAYGRPVQGSEPVTVRVGYTWEVEYTEPTSARIGWARLSGVPMTGNRARELLTLWQERTGKFTRWDQRAQGLGGWSLSVLHAYDPVGKVLHLGDGTRREEEARSLTTISTVAGGGALTGDGVPAVKARIGTDGFAIAPDGTFYIADSAGHWVRRMSPDGIINTVAGTGTAGFSGDDVPGLPATQAQLNQPFDVALGPDGSLYIVDFGNYRVRKVRPDGTITTVAGNGTQPFNGDGRPATQTGMQPGRVVVGPDGSIYIADTFSQTHRVRVVDQNGIVSTVAGVGGVPPFLGPGYSGDGGPAIAAQLNLRNQAGLALGPDGSLYIAEGLIADGHRIRRVSPQGLISTVAGTGTLGFSGDGGLAINARITSPLGLAATRDGSLYIADWGNNRIRRVGSDGIITTVAGTGFSGSSGDGGPATQARIGPPFGVAEGPDGALYLSGLNATGDGRIRRVVSALPGFSFASDTLLPSSDGSEAYVFSGTGRHLRTVDGLTGGIRYQFDYDAAGYPISVTDGSGNVTTIERAGAAPTAIIAPGGQRTALVVDPDGWLTGATNPAGEARTMVSTGDGLLQQFTDPRGNTYRFTYDALGQLIKDEDPAGGSTSLARTEQPNGYTVTTTTALGRTRKYQVEQLSTGALRRTVIAPSGAKTVTVINTNGSAQTTDPAGSVATIQDGPDPRWGMLAPIATSIVVATPGGRTRTVTTARTATLTDPANPFSLTRLTETIADNGKVTTSIYDAALRLFTITSPTGRIGKLNIDTFGRITQEQIAALAPIGFAYNSRGLVSTIEEGSGTTTRTTSFTYNAARELSDITDSIGRTTNFAYDLAQRPLTQTLPDGRVIGLVYDASGNVASVTPPGRPAHAFSYNAVDLGTQYNPPNVAGVSPDETATSYNPDRQPTLVTRPEGKTIVPLYDSPGRVSSVAFSRGSLGVTYAPISGLPTTLSAPDAVGHAFTYDGGLLLSHMLSGPIPGVVAWTYDNDFRVASQSVNGANIVNVTYDRDSLLTQVGALSLTRDPTNGLLTGTKLNTVTDSLTYNAHAEPLDYRAKVGAADVYRTQFTRDALGRITQKIETIQGVTDTYVYSYDVSGRLIGVVKNGMTSSAYTYDVNSNRTSYTGPLGTVTLAQVTVDSQDRMTKYGVNTYTYNAHGDLTSKVNGAGTTNYTYDEFGNLTRVVLPGGTVIDYVIDAMNRRIGKKVNGTLVRRWLWSGALRVIAELDGSGILLSRFVYATRINVPDYIVQGAIIYRLVTDHLGSPRLLINIGTGAIVGAMNHDEYGRVTLDTMSALIPFGYAGGLYDSDTDFARFGVRDYDAETGRWTLKDPALFSGGSANIYTYVANNPISYVDPSGLQAEMTLVDPTAGNAKQQKNNRAIVDTANKYQSPDGTYTVFLHGVPGVGFDKDGKKLTAEDLARKISRDPEFDGRKYKTVRLAACQAGKDYAQEVFKFLARFGVTKVEYSDEKVFPNSATGKLQRSYKDDREIEFDWVPRN